MGNVLHIECPVCRAALGLFELDRIVTCPSCSTRSLVEGHSFVPEYCVEPACDPVAARRAIQTALTHKRMPRGLLKQSRFHSARLYFIPYNALYARRLGTVLLRNLPEGPASPGNDAAGRQSVKSDTRVVMADVNRIAPAVALDGWALEEAAICTAPQDALARLLPVSRSALARQGRIQSPTIQPDQILDSLKPGEMAASFLDHTEYVEKRLRRIYYPVWRLRYHYKGRLYWATVDGLSGAVMALRAPRDDRHRIGWLLAASMLVALTVGRFFHLLLLSTALGGFGALLAVLGIAPLFVGLFFAVGALLAVGVAAVAWDQFRYPGELLLKGGRIEFLTLKPPGENPVIQWILGLLEAFFRETDGRGGSFTGGAR